MILSGPLPGAVFGYHPDSVGVEIKAAEAVGNSVAPKGISAVRRQAASVAQASAQDFLNCPTTVGQRIHLVLHRHPALSPASVLLLAIICFSLLSNCFLTLSNLW